MPSHNINVQIRITRVTNGIENGVLADQSAAAPEPVSLEEMDVLINDAKALAIEEYGTNI